MFHDLPASVLTTSAEPLTDVPLDVLETQIPDGGVPRDLSGHVFIVGPLRPVRSDGLHPGDFPPTLNGNDDLPLRLR